MLEAVGLVKTYKDGKRDEVKNYEYFIYAPKTPKSFFEDALLFGMLIKYVGERQAKRLHTIYKVTFQEAEGEDVSATFGEVFHPDFSDPVFEKTLSVEKTYGRKTAKIDSEFNYDRFFEALAAISQIKQTAITKKELKEIERLATLYGVDEVNIASIVANLYEPASDKGKRINFKKMSEILQNEINYAFLSKPKGRSTPSWLSASTDLARKINLMEDKTPKDYLSVLQNGTTPASPDLRLVDDLSRKFNLTNGVLNALIDFVLTTNNNVLSRPLCEKIAASLAREGIVTALDAMNYLKSIAQGAKKVTKITYTTKVEAATHEEKEETTQEDLDWDELMKHMEDDE
jgi:replication initiation and membrane attachment protein